MSQIMQYFNYSNIYSQLIPMNLNTFWESDLGYDLGGQVPSVKAFETKNKSSTKQIQTCGFVYRLE